MYGTPGGAVEVVALIASGYLGYYLHNRILVSMIGLTVAMIGIILIVALPLTANGGRLAGYYMTQASPTPFVALLSLISSNVAGYTKKTTVAAIYLICYCAGNIIGPQTFRPSDAPEYRPAEITILACWAACLVDLLFIYLWCRYQNRSKEKVRAEPGYEKLRNVSFPCKGGARVSQSHAFRGLSRVTHICCNILQPLHHSFLKLSHHPLSNTLNPLLARIFGLDRPREPVSSPFSLFPFSLFPLSTKCLISLSCPPRQPRVA